MTTESQIDAGKSAPRIAVVIPCHRAATTIGPVLAAIGPEVAAIYIVDDACPHGTGDKVEAQKTDARIRVLRRAENGGVGAATMTGMMAAAVDGADILVKLDADGQMDPDEIPRLIQPLLAGQADYAKGNRFHDLAGLRAMPKKRLIGNALLSFVSKFSSGYWDVFDPTNGFIALHRAVFEKLPKEKIAPRYFFENDMLFRLGLLRAVVADVPMPARYNNERSGLKIRRVFFSFVAGHFRNFWKRLFYQYLLRDFSVGSLYLLFGMPLFVFGVIFGAWQWIAGIRSTEFASAGTVMLAGLSVIVGLQFLLAFLAFDVQTVPRKPVHGDLAR